MPVESLKMKPKEFDLIVRLIEIHLNKIKGEKEINDLADTGLKKENPDIAFFELLISKVKNLKSDDVKTDKIESFHADEVIFRSDSKVVKRIKFEDSCIL